MGMLTTFRRHLRGCAFHGKTHQRTARANSCEKKCPIWVQGTLGGERVRRSLDLRSWEADVALVQNVDDAVELAARHVHAGQA